jgi:hypothetical protein
LDNQLLCLLQSIQPVGTRCEPPLVSQIDVDLFNTLRRTIMARHRMLTAVFRDRFKANEALDWLRDRGYTSKEISVLMSNQTQQLIRKDADEEHHDTGSKAAAGVATGGAIGTVVGASLAAIAAIGTSLVLPGLGLVVAGPLAAAFAGGGAGAVAGGLLGGLVGYGIPESNAKAYEEALRDGGVAIGVIPRSDSEATVIENEFENLHGENIIYA